MSNTAEKSYFSTAKLPTVLIFPNTKRSLRVMKLTDAERAVALQIYFRADASVAEVARELNLKEHTVRYAIKKLKDNGVFFSRPVINSNALGFSAYQLFISIGTPGEEAKEKLIKVLQSSENVAWLGGVGGPYDLDIIIYTRGTYNTVKFFDWLSESTQDIDFEVNLSLSGPLVYFSPRYLDPTTELNETFYLSRSEVKSDVDETDHDILMGLMADDYSSTAQLSKKLGLPNSTVNDRIEKLKQSGVIAGFVNFLNPYIIGYTPYLLLLEFQKPSSIIQARLEEFCLREKSTTMILRDLGAWDFQIGLCVSDQREVGAVVGKFHEAFSGDISKITSLPVYDSYKLDMYPFKSLLALVS